MLVEGSTSKTKRYSDIFYVRLEEGRTQFICRRICFHTVRKPVLFKIQYGWCGYSRYEIEKSVFFIVA